MNRLSRLGLCCALLLSIAFTSSHPSYAQTSTPVAQQFYTFTSGSQGTTPSTPLIQASDGNFYGGTEDGGATSQNDQANGTIYRLTSGATLTTLYAFDEANGTHPSYLMQGSDSNIYGTTSTGGADNYGTIFKMTLGGSLTTLYSFMDGADGAYPNFLIQGTDGNIYGTAEEGGNDGGGGTVFKYTTSGQFQVLGSFSYSDGYPQGILQAQDGNFYGVLNGAGGGYPSGIYKTSAAGPASIVQTFNIGGALETPVGQFVEGSDGSLYGAVTGGEFADGGVFKLPASGGTASLIFTASSTYGAINSGLFAASDGNFYGTTVGVYDSTTNSYVSDIYSVTPSGDFTLLALFPEAFDSSGISLLQASDGYLYSPANPAFGGSASGGVFRVEVPIATQGPVQLALTPSQISAGQQATLTWNVTNANSETFRQCFASGAWSGLQASSGSISVTQASDGNYNYALTCGGVETGTASLQVGDANAASSVNVVATSSTVKPGDSVTLLINVNSANGSGPAPTGSVTLEDYGHTLFATTLNNGSASFTVNGTELPVGPASFTVVYGGDANYAGSASKAVPVTFQYQPTLTIIAPSYVTAGHSVTYSVQVTSPSGSVAPTGTVSVTAGQYSATLTLKNGQATATIPASDVNTNYYLYIYVTYNGDTNYLTTSADVDVDVFPASVVSLNASSTQLDAGQKVTLVVEITGSSDYAPTGEVSFEVGSTVLATVPVSSNTATFVASTAGVPPGTYSVTAVYSGDANNGSGSSAPLNITVKDGTTTTLTATPNPVTLGQKITLSASVSRAAASGNPGGTVTFSTGSTKLGTVAVSNGEAVLSTTVSGVPTGTYPVVATYNGDGSDAGSVSQAVDVVVQQ